MNTADAEARAAAMEDWRQEIWSRADGMRMAGTLPVPLTLSTRLLSAGVIARAIELACFDMFGGRLAEETPALKFVITFDQTDLDERLQRVVLCSLRSGALQASGYDSRAAFDSPTVKIPAERWGTLTPDFARSEAESAGYRIVGITVERTTDPVAQSEAPARLPRKHVTPQDVAGWFKKAGDAARIEGTRLSRDETVQRCQDELSCDREAARAGFGRLPNDVRKPPHRQRKSAQ